MAYAKEELLEVRYDTKLKKLVLKKPKWTSRLKLLIKKHRFIASISGAFIMFSILNIAMIYSFMRILQNI